MINRGLSPIVTEIYMVGLYIYLITNLKGC